MLGTLSEVPKWTTWQQHRPKPNDPFCGARTRCIRYRRFAEPFCKTVEGGLRLLHHTSFSNVKRSHWKVLAYHRKEIPIVEARSIEEIYNSLTERLLLNGEVTRSSSSKYIVGLAGPPGAGKSTLASEVVQRLNVQWSQKASKTGLLDEFSEVAIAAPMDGFHLYRSQLDKMEDPEEAHARRGSPWTFDPVLLLRCLQTLRKQGEVSFPSFDHGIGDPVENDIVVSQSHKVVLVEGNYLLLEDGIWKEISSIFDERWFIEIDIDVAMQRVLDRHMLTGKAPDVAKWRVDYNDRPNAELIMKSKSNADVIIRSVDWRN